MGVGYGHRLGIGIIKMGIRSSNRIVLELAIWIADFATIAEVVSMAVFATATLARRGSIFLWLIALSNFKSELIW